MYMKGLSRRNRIIMYILAIMVVLSMIISAAVSFTPQPVRGTATPVPTQATGR